MLPSSLSSMKPQLHNPLQWSRPQDERPDKLSWAPNSRIGGTRELLNYQSNGVNETELKISAVTLEKYCLFETYSSVIFPVRKKHWNPIWAKQKLKKHWFIMVEMFKLCCSFIWKNIFLEILWYLTFMRTNFKCVTLTLFLYYVFPLIKLGVPQKQNSWKTKSKQNKTKIAYLYSLLESIYLLRI